tara:strand:+ start:39 stop:524 length:486 start_codon:yes stop_codon:yes gene_type:complete
MKTLQSIQEYLNDQNVESVLETASASDPMDKLVLSMGEDKSQINLPLILRLIEEDNLMYLHAIQPYPFEVKTSNLGEMARLLLMVNKAMQIPALGLSEVEPQVYFQYAYYSSRKVLLGDDIDTLIHFSIIFYQFYYEIIKKLAEGHTTLDVIIAEAKEVSL